MRQLADYAMIAFIEAIKKGFPIYAKKFMSDVILVRNRHGRGILYVNHINMDDGSRYITVAADKYSVWGVRVVRIKDGEIIEVNEHLVPDAIGQHIELISTYEVDVWSKRLKLFNKRRKVDDVPDLLKPFERMGARIMYIDDIFDYLVVFDDVVPVWYNKLTGKIDDSREWLKAMGLLPKELENVELKV
ncbi:hypothetical protein Pyrde_0648 [Pyrodictium delaneyi]|uniref:Uncharacterized protein n=1 Tax=Pyrodictium delaneyi TaxID=1273541 RepID=A0A0P0N1W9_9CREN|nr:hypothetical protein [Pyrodictium delaneyi]ALL00698.1 hypothetical protein Pyrde_0648 [Pyrodictium delaneyi]OWJ54143.1 hypothetical protein Pdsh_09850 [Pyrodictium delaneyi]